MGIGASLLLIAAGAILTFALNVTVSGIDLDVVGWILMGAGALGLIITLVMMSSRGRSTVSQRTISDPSRPGGPIVEEQRTYDDGAPPPVV